MTRDSDQRDTEVCEKPQPHPGAMICAHHHKTSVWSHGALGTAGTPTNMADQEPGLEKGIRKTVKNKIIVS